MLVPKHLFLTLVSSGRITFPFGESESEPGPATTAVEFELRPPHSPDRGAPGGAAGFPAKRDRLIAEWHRKNEEQDAASWMQLAECTSDAEWNEFWRGYPYTHNVRALCREYAEQAGLAAELAQLEEGEDEMQEVLNSAPPRRRESAADIVVGRLFGAMAR